MEFSIFQQKIFEIYSFINKFYSATKLIKWKSTFFFNISLRFSLKIVFCIILLYDTVLATFIFSNTFLLHSFENHFDFGIFLNFFSTFSDWRLLCRSMMDMFKVTFNFIKNRYLLLDRTDFQGFYRCARLCAFKCMFFLKKITV